MSNQHTRVTLNGKQFDADAVANLMDDELREELSSSREWVSEQEFVNAYAAAHLDRFGEEFEVN
ncbi:hypothetical protein [Pseudomonas aeruginosa]|uniref:hypothetical protein n=1 Tax=Pseudomonas aeruginosa TaxID=287 RepID=UPI000A8B0881|nr:hypothetical protein [Pseudomonas aeruginosa]MBG5813927.1 hypothetical protein [Pseudomonas aeruginosa]VFT16567.1 Uncharacterised protein [Pseudomonas aeruginosa]VFT53699.1 Uncharacterised protein [Pseudomonas aeruginosa]